MGFGQSAENGILELRRPGRLAVCFGFTLIELLVVVAIIGVLAALMFPTLSQSRVNARTAGCKSNLRQLGVALRLYLDDYAGTYPYVESLPMANSKGISYWFDALALMMPEAKWGEGVFKCPAYDGIVYEGECRRNSQGGILGVSSPCGSYAYNAAGRRAPSPSPPAPASGGLGFTVVAGEAAGRPVRENEVRAPVSLYVFGDSPVSVAQWGNGAKPRQGGAADYNSLLADNARIEAARHCRAFNMLFADLHAESVRTDILLNTDAVHRRRWNHDNLP